MSFSLATFIIVLSSIQDVKFNPSSAQTRWQIDCCGRPSDRRQEHRLGDGYVRTGLDVVEKEITSSGFKRVGELKDGLNENYLVEFEKVDNSDRKSDK